MRWMPQKRLHVFSFVVLSYLFLAYIIIRFECAHTAHFTVKEEVRIIIAYLSFTQQRPTKT